MVPDVFIRKDEPRHLAGLHVACIWQIAGEKGDLALEAYMNAVDADGPMRGTLPLASLSSWRDFRRELKASLRISKRSNNWGYLDLKQPFGLFSAAGQRLSSAEEVLKAQLVFVVEGGQWFWPPMRKGFVRQVSDGLELETVSVQPVLFRVRGFLREEECTDILKIAEGRMFNSPVSLMDKDKGKEAKEFRTSTQARIGNDESAHMGVINDRIARLTRVPVEHNEDVQVLRYQKTQYYGAHLDNWDPAFYSGQDTAFIEHGHNNRLITVFWYLSNVTEGGETWFPRSDGLPSPRDNYACDRGLKVKPERGTVIFWYSLRPNGNTDQNGVHAACPVVTGEKWSANYWVWNKPRGPFLRHEMPDAGIDEAEPDEATGTAFQEQAVQRKPGEVTAQFVNKFGAEKLKGFWLRPDDQKEVYMGELTPGETFGMNTFVGHKWVFRTAEAAKVVTIVADGEQRYEIGADHQDL